MMLWVMGVCAWLLFWGVLLSNALMTRTAPCPWSLFFDDGREDQ
jgi:hypothetical protein